MIEYETMMHPYTANASEPIRFSSLSHLIFFIVKLNASTAEAARPNPCTQASSFIIFLSYSLS
jgi:hypothetical protein